MLSRRLVVLCALGALLVFLGAYHPDVRARLAPSLPSFFAQDRRATLDVFSDIYVVSLPVRTDRHATMSRLRDALDLRWTYIDALSSRDPLVRRIESCVNSLRNQTDPGTIQWPSGAELADFVLRALEV